MAASGNKAFKGIILLILGFLLIIGALFALFLFDHRNLTNEKADIEQVSGKKIDILKEKVEAGRNNLKQAEDEIEELSDRLAEIEKELEIRENDLENYEEAFDEQQYQLEKAEYHAYTGLIRRASVKIGENCFWRADELLDMCPQRLRGWEWGRLKHMLNLDLRTFNIEQTFYPQMDLSPDGKYIALIHKNICTILDIESGKPAVTFDKHSNELKCVTFSPDGAIAATATRDCREIKLWSMKDKTLVKEFQGNGQKRTALRFSPDGKKLITSSNLGFMRLWDVETGEQLKFPERLEFSPVLSIQFSPDSKFIAIAGGWQKGKAAVLDLEMGSIVHSFEVERPKMMWNAVYSPDGKTILVSGEEGYLKLWDASFEKVLQSFDGHTVRVYSTAFSPDGTQIISSGGEGVVKVWDIQTGREIISLKGQLGLGLVRFHPDGKLFVTSAMDGSVKIWDRLKAEDPIVLEKGKDIRGVHFLEKGKNLLTACFSDGGIRVWDIETRSLARTIGNHKQITGIRVSPDRKLLATTGTDGFARVWNIEKGEEVFTSGKETPLWHPRFSPDGRYLTVTSWHTPAVCWDLISKSRIMPDAPLDKGTWASEYTSDGSKILVSQVDGKLLLYDPRKGEDDMKELPLLCHAFNMTRVGDTDLFFTGSFKDLIGFYDLKSNEYSVTFRGHMTRVIGMDISPGGKRVVTGGYDGSAKVWDIKTGEELLELAPDLGAVVSVEFSPDGRLIAVGCMNGVKIYRGEVFSD